MTTKPCIATKVPGLVKWFNPKSGHGVICSLDNHEDVYVNQTAIIDTKPLGYSEMVELDIVLGSQGLEAANVTVVKEALDLEKRKQLLLAFASLRSPLNASSYSSYSLLTQVPAVRAPPVWATAEKITNRIGQVTSIIDENYGLAVVKYRPVEELEELHTAIVLFDTCDLWLSADLGQPQVASNLGVSIEDVVTERDYVKLNAILVPQSDNQKNIRYIATSLITDPSKREIRIRPIPEMAPIDNLDQIHPEKINNFHAVVSAICQNLPGEPEDEIRDVSSDEAGF